MCAAARFNEGSQALMGWLPAIAAAVNFGDFCDFGFNFVNFSCPHQSDLVKMNAAYDDYYT